MRSKPETQGGRPPAALTLLLLSVALLLLSLFQWIELLVVRAGGTTVCAVNQTINCERVWDSPFALRVHQLTHVPVAGWGTVFSLTALTLSLLFAVRRRHGGPEGTRVAGLQWTAVAGMISCLIFAFASARAGAVCLTCLTTYVLTFGFAGAAFLMLPMQLLPPTPSALDGLLLAAGLTVAGFLVVLYPGQKTPHGGTSALPQSAGEGGPITLETMVPRLSAEDLQTLSDATAEYQRSAPPVKPHPPRLRNGPATAPIQVVDFTDVLCPALPTLHGVAGAGARDRAARLHRGGAAPLSAGPRVQSFRVPLRQYGNALSGRASADLPGGQPGGAHPGQRVALRAPERAETWRRPAS